MLAWASSIGAHNTRNARVTHIITSGGGFLCIPNDKRDEFEEQYARESVYADRSVTTLSELPSDGVFPMFFKINNLNKTGLTRDNMLQICTIVVGVLRLYYPDNTATSIFESTVFPASSAGFSLVFRSLFVNKGEALQLRHTLVYELDGRLGCSEYPWSGAVAREVYVTGMEMYGSGRSVSCAECSSVQPVSGAEQGALHELEKMYTELRRKIQPIKGFAYGSVSNIRTVESKSQEFNQLYLRLLELRGVQTCKLCIGTGTHWEKNQSSLHAVALDGSGKECPTATELLTGIEVIRYTTVRAPPGQASTPGFSRPIDTPVCPPAGTADMLREGGYLRKGTPASLFIEATNSDVYMDDHVGILGWKMDNEVTDPGTVDSIQTFIRTRMGRIDGNKHYANVRVKNVFALVDKKKPYQKSGERIIRSMIKYTNGEVAEPKAKFFFKKLWVRVQGQGSCFCANRVPHARHESNSVYFEMGPNKCQARCFCTDDTLGTSGKMCREYSTGSARSLPDKLLALFTPLDGNSGPIVLPAVPIGAVKKPRILGRNGKEVSEETQRKCDFWDSMIAK